MPTDKRVSSGVTWNWREDFVRPLIRGAAIGAVGAVVLLTLTIILVKSGVLK